MLDGLLLGAADYKTLQRAMVVALLAFVPLGAAVALHHSLGIVAVWLALACWLSGRSVLLGWQWAKRSRLGAATG